MERGTVSSEILTRGLPENSPDFPRRISPHELAGCLKVDDDFAEENPTSQIYLLFAIAPWWLRKLEEKPLAFKPCIRLESRNIRSPFGTLLAPLIVVRVRDGWS